MNIPKYKFINGEPVLLEKEFLLDQVKIIYVDARGNYSLTPFEYQSSSRFILFTPDIPHMLVASFSFGMDYSSVDIARIKVKYYDIEDKIDYISFDDFVKSLPRGLV